MVNPFEETRQAGMQQVTPTFEPSWDQTSGITHQDLGGYDVMPAEGTKLNPGYWWQRLSDWEHGTNLAQEYLMGEEGMANASREYNNFQVRANEPSARDQRLWMYNQARDENKQPLFFDTVPGDPYGDWIHRMRYFDTPDTMEAKIDLDEIFRNYPDLDIWRLIQNLDARGIDYAANDRGIGSLDEYQMAELTQGQKDMMGNPLNTPDFGVSKQDLWKKVKDMENKKWDLQWGVQEPTTQEEYDDYYRQLQAGTVGNWVT